MMMDSTSDIMSENVADNINNNLDSLSSMNVDIHNIPLMTPDVQSNYGLINGCYDNISLYQFPF